MAQTLAMPPEAARTAEKKAPLPWSHPALVALAYAVVVIVAQLVIHRHLADYVGPDNDDAMRLVEVRDFLAGQGWFDMMQYRLGLDGGTLMHWSRFIDLPIASLILFFRMFFSPEGAEAAALTVWPLMLVLPLMVFMGLAGRRVAQPQRGAAHPLQPEVGMAHAERTRPAERGVGQRPQRQGEEGFVHTWRCPRHRSPLRDRGSRNCWYASCPQPHPRHARLSEADRYPYPALWRVDSPAPSASG